MANKKLNQMHEWICDFAQKVNANYTSPYVWFYPLLCCLAWFIPYHAPNCCWFLSDSFQSIAFAVLRCFKIAARREEVKKWYLKIISIFILKFNVKVYLITFLILPFLCPLKCNFLNQGYDLIFMKYDFFQLDRTLKKVLEGIGF